MKKSAWLTITAILLIQPILFGCDAEIKSTSGRSAVQLAPGDHNVSFDCNKRKYLTCESGYQFCIRSTMALDRNWYKTSECIEKPAECNACDCSIESAKAYYSKAKNCKGEIYCRYDKSKIVVTCVVPDGAATMDREPSRNMLEKPAGDL